MEKENATQSEIDKGVPQDWAELIRKLRWMGMEDEAARLQAAACRLPADKHGTVSAGPFSTD